MNRIATESTTSIAPGVSSHLRASAREIQAGQHDSGWHTHASSADAKACELTVAICDADRPELDEKWRRYFAEDIWLKGEG